MFVSSVPQWRIVIEKNFPSDPDVVSLLLLNLILGQVYDCMGYPQSCVLTAGTVWQAATAVTAC